MIHHVCLLVFLCQLAASQKLLVSFHGGKSTNVGVFGVDGSYLGNVFPKNIHASLRSMVYVKNQLLMAEAKTDNSILGITGCLGTPASVSSGSKFAHPFGLAFDSSIGRVYVSNQDGNNAVFFNPSSPNTVQLFVSLPGSPRGIAVHPATGRVWIGNTGNQPGVMIFDSKANLLKTIPMSHPIGVFVYGDRVFVSNDDHSAPYVYVYSALSFSLLEKITVRDDHPAGMAIIGDTLFVVGQTNSQMASYNATTGAFIGVLTTFSDVPEGLILGYC